MKTPRLMTGLEILQNPSLNKSTAFTEEEREAFNLRGLLPYRVCSQQTQITRALENMRRKESDIEKYIFLLALQGRNSRLFYKLVIEHIDEILPLIYTPTVGQACKEFAHIFRQPKGFYITPADKGRIRHILDNWPRGEVRVAVVTDGERILGLGDLGANGMGIPIGKLSLYVACAGIHPHQTLPVMLDVGTDNEELLNDPLYLGWPHHRLKGRDYDELVDEFVQALLDKYPDVLLQFEDFATPNAYKLLDRYRDRVLCFNDDIQGTAATALAGVFAATRITKIPFAEMRFLFLGAGSAATGIGNLICSALQQLGLTAEEARRRLWFVDLDGLIVEGRGNLQSHNRHYAHDHPPRDLMGAIEDIRPHVLMGATGHGGAFSEAVIRKMAAVQQRPIIFALSNPTSKAECTAEQAYQWSEGRAVFASGSPFPEVQWKNQVFKPGQGNNAYVFPGIGLGAIAVNASRISDAMFLTAAKGLASMVKESDIARGTVYPKMVDIREVSLKIALEVAETAYEEQLAQLPRPADLREHIQSVMFEPSY